MPSGGCYCGWIRYEAAGTPFDETSCHCSICRRTTGCPRCGTQLTFEHEDLPDEIDVTTCSLDDPNLLPPRDHTRTSSKLRWVHLCDGLAQYPEGRQDDG